MVFDYKKEYKEFTHAEMNIKKELIGRGN